MITAFRRWILGLTAIATVSALGDGRARAQTSGVIRLEHDFVLSNEQLIARVQAIERHLPAVPGEVLVKFRPGTELPAQVRALSVVRGGAQQARWVGDFLVVRSENEPNSVVLADVLARQPEVEWAQPNYISYLESVPNDPAYSRQWNMTMLNMPVAWDISGTRSTGVTVAVVDSGVTTVTASYNFPLWTGSQIATFPIPYRVNPDIGTSRFAASRDFIFWNGPVLDMVGHGTHVAGTVLQETNNQLGLAGIASHARLMALKACVGYWEFQFVRSALGIPGLSRWKTKADVQRVKWSPPFVMPRMPAPR
jgi:subtilisin family serine protease